MGNDITAAPTATRRGISKRLSQIGLHSAGSFVGLSLPTKKNSKDGEFTTGGGAPTSDEELVFTDGSSKVSLADFEMLKIVGQGASAKVIQARHKQTGRIFAIKVLKKAEILKKKEDKEYERTMAERRILQRADNHPFIASLRFAFSSPKKLYMAFDFYQGGELYYYLHQERESKFTEPTARFYAAELVLALGHLHSLSIVYRDLKPENILLDREGHVRLTDFGLSKENVNKGDMTCTSFCGTPEYLAPEIIKKKKYGHAVDWWALGTLLYEMLAGLPPFYDQSRDKMYKKICDGDLKFPNHFSDLSKLVLKHMLSKSPESRLGYSGDADEIKKHPFFSWTDFEELYEKRTEPPIRPSVQDELDVGNFGKEFTERNVFADSPKGGNRGSGLSAMLLGTSSGSGQPQEALFENFFYVQESLLEETGTTKAEVERAMRESQMPEEDLRSSSEEDEEAIPLNGDE